MKLQFSRTAICVIALIAISSGFSVAQEQMSNLKVKSPRNGQFDQQTIQNLQILQSEATTKGSISVWVVLNFNYNPDFEIGSAEERHQARKIDRLKQRVVRKLQIDPATVQSPTDGPYFSTQIRADQLENLARMPAVKGYWGLY